MRYVAYLVNGQLQNKKQNLPDVFPVECEEFDSLEEATLAHPDRIVTTVDEYNVFKNQLDQIYSSELAFIKATMNQPKGFWAKTKAFFKG